MQHEAYDLTLPKDRTTCVVFASPHSGRAYSEAFLARAVLNEQAVRSSEDAFVDMLFAAAPACGAPFLTARAPRAFVDLNRGPDEMDPALIAGVRRLSHNPRVASGLGVIPRVVSNGRPIYHGKMTLNEAHSRITQFWRPYHDQLQTLMDQSRNMFGQAILVDCHSMPHEALDSMATAGQMRPDVVLGDRFGASASNLIVEQLEAAFATAGLRVARNMPFAGAYITQHYGRPSRKQHAVQIEINRALYMDEATLTPTADFAAFKAVLNGVIRDVADIGTPDRRRVAAE